MSVHLTLAPRAAVAVLAVVAPLAAVTLAGQSAGAAPLRAPALAPRFAHSAAVTPASRSCAVDVTRYSSAMRSRYDNTPEFAHAMQGALAHHPNCFRVGPSGHSQAVVYVPPGTYRLANLKMPSNVRLEVNAAAVLQQPHNRPARATKHAIPMIIWDSAVRGRPITNVSITGVSASMSAAKRSAMAVGGTPLATFDLSHDFTMNLDPATTGSTNYNQGVDMSNVRHFLVQNVFSIQNNRNQYTHHVTTWPTSSRAVLELHARNNSPKGRLANYMQPMFGMVRNQVNINGPRGFGPNQINAVYNVHFQNIYSLGGTALRVETDGSQGPHGITDRGASVDGLYAHNIVGVNCNRAVSLSPHTQRNGRVSVSNVWAYGCYQAVIARLNKDVRYSRNGRFSSATVTGVQVTAGTHAQIDADRTLWRVGRSVQPVYISKHLSWTPHISLVRYFGTFSG